MRKPQNHKRAEDPGTQAETLRVVILLAVLVGTVLASAVWIVAGPTAMFCQRRNCRVVRLGPEMDAQGNCIYADPGLNLVVLMMRNGSVYKAATDERGFWRTTLQEGTSQEVSVGRRHDRLMVVDPSGGILELQLGAGCAARIWHASSRIFRPGGTPPDDAYQTVKAQLNAEQGTRLDEFRARWPEDH